MVVSDFDNGLSANDASGVKLGINDLGLGNDEVMTAGGDSGGPSLIDGKVAAVTSFRQGFLSAPDVLPDANSSFGEFAINTRVSAFASWIDSVVDIVGPTVVGVSVSGPNTADGNYDIPGGSGEQLKTAPVGGANKITITFSEQVDVDQADLTLYRTISNTVHPSTGFTSTGTTATWTFSTLPRDKCN